MNHRHSLLAGLLAALGILGWAAVASAEDASALLKLAGVRQGLCIHLGCGRQASAGLTADLAAGSDLLVHGLALDPASCHRARVAVQKRGLTGKAQVEFAPASPLPYVSDLANLVIVEDVSALAARGVTRAEIERVLAPGGICLQRRGARWERKVKPRRAGADDWTHPRHDAGGNRVSSEPIISPVGLRWQDGLPLNIVHWASCRSWVAAGGRVFSLSMTEYENLKNAPVGQVARQQWLVARDAANGIPLWKLPLGTTEDRSDLNTLNTAPLCTDGKYVFAPREKGLVVVDAATGKVTHDLPVAAIPARILAQEGAVVSAGWEGVARREMWDAAPESTKSSLWDIRIPKSVNGAVEAYDAATGKLLWKDPVVAQTLFAADGLAVYLVQAPPPVEKQILVAREIKTGRERWRVEHTAVANQPDLLLIGMAKGFVVLGRHKVGTRAHTVGCNRVVVLSSADGKKLWEAEGSSGPMCLFTGGELWYGSKRYNPATGEVLGLSPFGMSAGMCTPPVVIGSLGGTGRGGTWSNLDPAAKGTPNASIRTGGVRASCVQGVAVSDGRIYFAQNWCRCAPAQVPGFVALGSQEDATEADFQAARPVESAGKTPSASAEPAEWPTLRHDINRSGVCDVEVPTELVQKWRAVIAPPAENAIANVWRSDLQPVVSAPVAGGGTAYLSACSNGETVALDLGTGKERWRAATGSRIDSPPTLSGGLCLTGSHDGWVYALNPADGSRVWRTRIAPRERRMVAFGQVESSWPVIGSPLVVDGVAYCVAGRSTEMDGGCAFVALDAVTGKTRWASRVAVNPGRRADMLVWQNGAVSMQGWTFSPADGKLQTPMEEIRKRAVGNLDGLIDGSWTRLGTRRSGGHSVGKLQADVASWDGDTTYAFATDGRYYGAFAIGRTPASEYDPAKGPAAFGWRWPCPRERQVQAMAVTKSAVVAAGRVWGDDPKPGPGFLVLLSKTDGKLLAEFPLPSPPVYHGIAVTSAGIILSLEDGSAVCFGKP